jgi:hypothetical protein
MLETVARQALSEGLTAQPAVIDDLFFDSLHGS